MSPNTAFACCLLSLASTVAQAAAPQYGTVIEGEGVPAIALGDARITVEAAIGPPQFCQSAEVAGDHASCSFSVAGGGTVSIRYRGADGGNAGNRPDDIVHAIRWYEAVNGWVTTAGVDTTLAVADPDAVVAAYPNGEVTYNMFGDIFRLSDAALGIEVIWALDFYTGTTHVSMAVFTGSEGGDPPPPPPQEPELLVTAVDVSGQRHKRMRMAEAVVEVQDGDDDAAGGALVRAHWTHPDGSRQTVVDVTSLSGFAHFETTGDDRGTYALTIDTVELDNHDFDAAGSVLEGSVFIK